MTTHPIDRLVRARARRNRSTFELESVLLVRQTPRTVARRARELSRLIPAQRKQRTAAASWGRILRRLEESEPSKK